MKAVVDLVMWLEDFAPPRLAESWDNVGLLWGDPGAVIDQVMTCLTVTNTTAQEAITAGAGLILSHHPILFQPVQRITVQGNNPHAFLWHLARAGVAVVSPHTAFDNCNGGINDTLAARLGLVEVEPLRPAVPAPCCKVVVFTPESDREAVLDAAFAAGAGRIGAYRECAFGTPGTGTFFGAESTHPAVGQKGRREQVAEIRLELLCPEADLGRVRAAVRAAHSYEEPAIDVYALKPEPTGPGIGRVGNLPQPEPLGALAGRVARLLDAPGTRFVGDPARPIERVAIACGAGDDFLRDARCRSADVLLTGEARFHRALEAESLQLGLIVAGHHATERIGVEALADRLARAFTDLTIWPSRTEHDPWRLV